MIMVYRISFLLVLLVSCISSAYSDTCPTPDSLRERKIPGRYEWTVQEGVSLENILGAQRLYAVRIYNFDKYVSCRYTTGKWPVKIDGKPLNVKCRLLPETGVWTGTDSGTLVCREKDPAKCGFRQDCEQDLRKNPE